MMDSETSCPAPAAPSPASYAARQGVLMGWVAQAMRGAGDEPVTARDVLGAIQRRHGHDQYAGMICLALVVSALELLRIRGQVVSVGDMVYMRPGARAREILRRRYSPGGAVWPAPSAGGDHEGVGDTEDAMAGSRLPPSVRQRRRERARQRRAAALGGEGAGVYEE